LPKNFEEAKDAYEHDEFCSDILTALKNNDHTKTPETTLNHYKETSGLLYFVTRTSPRLDIPNDPKLRHIKVLLLEYILPNYQTLCKVL